jgi:hypothetical protein
LTSVRSQDVIVMTLISTSQPTDYAIAEAALRRWVADRLRRHPRADDGVVYTFLLSGSTCNNVPLDAVMTVAVDAQGRIEAATSAPAPADRGCGATCAADGDGRAFLALAGRCDEVVGLTLAEAAFRNWEPEPSGCFCSAGNRRHKWRNVFQALHYAATHHDG